MSEPTRVGQGLWEARQVRILGRDHEEACAKVHSPHRDGLLPPSLVEDVVSLGAQWQGEDKLESPGSCECRSWAAFWHTDLQIEVTDAFLPLSKFRVNSSFAPLTGKQPAKRILGNVVQINPVAPIQTPAAVYVHVVHSMMCEGVMGNAKCTACTARIYEEDLISKERCNGPFNSTRWHSTKGQKKMLQTKTENAKKKALERMIFTSVLFPISYFHHSLNSFKKKKNSM